MTNDEKAKAYDEALERARKIHDEIVNNEVIGFPGQITDIFPELRESEDERIRKEMISFLRSPFIKENLTDEKVAPWIAYLEKQKEQNDDEGDFTIYHPQKNGDGKYECIPFSFYGSLTSFSDDKDLMDFLNESFYDKEECERWCEVENKPELPECKHKIKKDSCFDYLCESSSEEKQKEQKPISSCYIVPYIDDKIAALQDMWREEKVSFDWDDMKDMIEDVARHFYQKEQKPAEWSEEDADILNCCISSIEEAKENRYAYKETDGDTSYDRSMTRITSAHKLANLLLLTSTNS